MDVSQYLSMFIEESKEHLQSLNEQLLVLEKEPDNIITCPNAEIAVLRSGKAKKNDPPIPADLAPISGSGKRVRKTLAEKEESLLLEPIRFRYSTESVVEESQPEEPAQEEVVEPKATRSRRRRKHHSEAKPEQIQEEQAVKEKKEAPVKEPKPQKEQQKEPKPQAEEADSAKKPRRRPNHRRRRPKGAAESTKE